MSTVTKARPSSSTKMTAGPPIGLPNSCGPAEGGVGRLAGPGVGAFDIRQRSSQGVGGKGCKKKQQPFWNEGLEAWRGSPGCGGRQTARVFGILAGKLFAARRSSRE